MLRETINIKDLEFSLEELTLTGTCSFTDNALLIPTNDDKVREGDIIHIKRNDGSAIKYDTQAVVISNVNGLLTVGYSFPYVIKPVDVTRITDKRIAMGNDEDFLVFKFFTHFYRMNRDNIVITSNLDKDYIFSTATTQCIDYKHFIYNDKYGYKSKDKDSAGKFTLSANNFENYNSINLTYGTGITFDNGFTPLDDGGIDSTEYIYFPWKSDYADIVNNKRLLTLSGYDPRYFNIANGNTLSLRDGVTILKEKNASLTIGLGELFTPNISIEEDINGNYIDGRIEASINKPIDYEKKMFEPVYLKLFNMGYTGNTVTIGDVDKIKFNLYFRNREIPINDSDWYINGEGWNRDIYSSGGTITPLYGDPLGVIGFTDNDVFNRNQRFAKSFIRLSFFDSPDRKKQVLQFYSTIFFDTTEMYNRFMKNKNTVSLGVDEQYVDKVTTDETKSLSCTFSCSSKRDTMASSEGFYLYLFDSVLNGIKPTPLYMLVEFNHAKYGKTIPMMMPRKNTGKGTMPIPYTDSSFPRGYVKSDNNAFYADMTKFYNDLFIKVYVKYDDASGRYIWYLPYEMNSREWVFNLYEPQLNY